jgi:hypothetical protein
MSEYKPNSHRYKEEQKKAATEKKEIRKVVSGGVKTRKKNEIRKFTDIFISEDATNVKSYIFTDVFIPAAKKLISDIVRDGIDMILYGGSGQSKSSTSTPKVSYRNYYDQRDTRTRPSEPRSSSRFDYEDLEFERRGDAEAVLDLMRDALARYQIVTVADMYEFSGLTEPYTSNKYGWTNLQTAYVDRTRKGGFIIRLPKAMVID